MAFVTSAPVARTSRRAAVCGAPVRRACGARAAAGPTMGLGRDVARLAGTAACAALLAFAPMDADAARSGGRVGGSSFRSPAAQTAPVGGGGYAPAGAYGGGYGYGGGFFGGPSLFYSPMIVPVGGGVGTLLVAGTVAALAYRAIQERQEDKIFEEMTNPETSVVTVKIGLLATARAIQVDLGKVAESADTGSVEGLRFVLEEAVLSLLRNPDRWMYGSLARTVKTLDEAEDAFNRVCMEQRLKIRDETVTNVSGNMRKADPAAAPADPLAPPPEYLVVSLVLAATERDLMRELPAEINSSADLNRALGIIGGVSTDSLQAVELIWAPASLTDTLTEQEMLMDHPELRQI